MIARCAGSQTSMSTAPTPPSRVSVVVASRNRRAELLATLPRHPEPVFLVDNGSSDGSADTVRAHLPHVHVIALPRNLGAPARNVGATAATTPYVAFADDDSWWAPRSLDAAVEILDAHDDIAIVCARILVGDEQRRDPLCAEMARAPLGLHAGSGLPLVTGFAACGAVVRRSAFLAAGGFDEIVFFPGEEERLVYDLLTAGRSLVYAAGIVAHHHPSASRHGHEQRTTAIVRSAVLTAVMRRPWAVVARRIREAVTDGAPARAGVRAATASLTAALRARRAPDPRVESVLSRMGDAPADVSVGSPQAPAS